MLKLQQRVQDQEEPYSAQEAVQQQQQQQCGHGGGAEIGNRTRQGDGSEEEWRQTDRVHLLFLRLGVQRHAHLQQALQVAHFEGGQHCRAEICGDVRRRASEGMPDLPPGAEGGQADLAAAFKHAQLRRYDVLLRRLQEGLQTSRSHERPREEARC